MTEEVKQLIRRADHFEIKVESRYIIKISLNNREYQFPNRVLEILMIFSEPLSFADGIKRLKIISKADWIINTEIIYKLLKIGVLVRDGVNNFYPDKKRSSFGAAPIHIKMLNDRPRTEGFIKAIQELVCKDDIVVDIGTGTGILALVAARAGAKKVYAIEAGAMADVAQDAFNKSEVADRITLIRGRSTQIELPEKADVLVSEIIGNDPFGENILPVFLDARKRLLKPDARLIPDRIQVYAMPVELSDAFLKNAILKDQDLKNWKEWYDIDLSSLEKMHDQSSYIKLIDPVNHENIRFIDQEYLLTDIDLTTFLDLNQEKTENIVSVKGFNGFLVYFNARIGSAWLTNHPSQEGRASHWLNPIWYFKVAEEIQPDSQFTLCFNYSEAKKTTLKLNK